LWFRMEFVNRLVLTMKDVILERAREAKRDWRANISQFILIIALIRGIVHRKEACHYMLLDIGDPRRYSLCIRKNAGHTDVEVC
jgi:hypothetical protein